MDMMLWTLMYKHRACLQMSPMASKDYTATLTRTNITTKRQSYRFEEK